MPRHSTLLINPPLWNAYAPHLAVPLLAGTLKTAGWPVRSLDLGIETIDHLLSRQHLATLGNRLSSRDSEARSDGERRELARARLLLPSATRDIDCAKATLRDVAALDDHARFLRAEITKRNALHCISAAYEGLSFDLVANEMYHSARSLEGAVRASQDADRNVYLRPFEDLLSRELDDPRLQVVAISVSADTQIVAALTVAAVVRARRRDVKILAGGNYMTRLATKWRNESDFIDAFDYVACYEGEDAIVAFSEAVAGERTWTEVPGLVWRDDGRLVKNHTHDVDLSRSPVPDYSDLDLGKYLAPGPVFPLFASRSCAWSCAFCSIPFASQKFRMRAPDAVVDEMDDLHARYGAQYFMFVDEIMTIKSLRGVSEELLRRRRNYHWYGETRFAKGLSTALAEQLYASGCRRLDLGLESYNQRILDLMKKEIKLEWVDDNLHALLSAGIPVHLFSMIGFPTETAEEAARTMRFVDATLDRSRTSYNVPYSTAGTSAFVLDVLSPVGQDPAAFGVELTLVDRKDDLALDRRYRTSAGLSEADSQQIADLLEGDIRDSDGVWFHQSRTKDLEEFVFLRAVTGATLPSVPDGPINLAFSDSNEFAHSQLRGDVTAAVLDCSVRSGVPGPHLIFYRATLDRLLEYPLAEGVVGDPSSMTLPELLLVAGMSGPDAARVLADLDRFLFLCGSPQALDESCDPPGTTWFAERACNIQQDGADLRISSLVTGRTVTLPSQHVWLWEALTQPEGLHVAELNDVLPKRVADATWVALQRFHDVGIVRCYAADAQVARRSSARL